MNLPVSDYISSKLNDFEQRLRALETQQLTVITNSAGHAVAQMGLQADGTVALRFFDSNNDELVNIDGSGLKVFDPSGNLRTFLGHLANGDYGMAVYSLANDGTYQEVLPPKSNFGGNTSQNTTSASPVALSNSPSVTATVGASGNAVITASGLLDGTSSGQPQCTVYMDGSALSYTGFLANYSASILVCSAQQLFTGISAGSHTFVLRCSSFNGAGANFQAMNLTVQTI